MKISLRTMLIWVAFAAVAAAALARPSLLWTRLLFTCAAVFLGWALIGALAARGRQRVFWIGAATAGLAYAFLFSGSRSSPYGGEYGFELGRALVTHQLLESTAAAIGHEDPMAGSRATVWDPMIFWNPPSLTPAGLPPPIAPTAWRQAYDPVEEQPALATETVVEEVPMEADAAPNLAAPTVPPTSTIPPPVYAPSTTAYTTPALTPPMPWTSYPPMLNTVSPYTSQSAYSQFLICGHCAFLILVAAIGGTLARWKFGGQEEVLPRHSATAQ